MKTLGFDLIHADASIFINKRGIIIRLYVDNLLIFAKNEIKITYTPMNKMLADRFMKPLDQVKFR